MNNRIIISIGIFLFLGGLWYTITPEKSVLYADESPYGRDAYRSEMRAHSATPQKIEAAKSMIASSIEKRKNYKDGGLSTWEELGPGQYAGRTRAIAVDPRNTNTLWVGGVSGGLWKSTNTGNSWSPKGQSISNFSITSILIDPDHPDTMYVSTGEGITSFGARAVTEDNPFQSTPGGGVFRSFDGGDTWERVPGISDLQQQTFFLWINKIAFEPGNPSTFYAVTTDRNTAGIGSRGSIYKFEDYGASFTFLDDFPSGGALDIEIDPSNTTRIYIGYEDALVMSSLSGGTLDFTSQNGSVGFPAISGRVELAIDPSVSTTVYALCEGDATNVGLLYKSTNGGLSWTDMNLSVDVFSNGAGQNQGWYNNTIWVDPVDPDLVIIGGIRIYRSTDGGASFTQISSPLDYFNGTSAHADCHIVVPASNYSASARVLYFGTDGGICRAPNITNTSLTSGWQIRNGTTLNTTQFYAFDVAGSSTNPIIIGGAQDNGTLMSSQDGTAWSHEIGGDGGFCAISRQDTAYRYATQQNGRIFLRDAIGIWRGFDTLSRSPRFISPIAIFPDDGTRMLAGDQGLTLYRADIFTIGPVNTRVVDPTTPRVGVFISAIDISADGSKVVVGYTNGEVWIGTPGVTWDWGAGPVISLFRPITSVNINPNNFNKIAVSTGGYFDNNIHFSNNNGATWLERSSGIPALHVNKLLWHYSNPDWIYAGSDLGVYASEDNGENWNITPHFDLNDGPVFTEVTDLEWGPNIQALDAPNLYVATYGRGIWKTQTGARSDIYFDYLFPGQNLGTSVDPYRTIEDGEATQASGQTWHITGGNYETSKTIILDRRLGEIQKTGVGSVIIGDNN